VTWLFSSALATTARVEEEKARLTVLGDSVLSLSIVVNSLETAEYRNVLKKFHEALARTDKAFDDMANDVLLPKMNDELGKAFEVIGNMRALMADDLKTLDQQYSAFQPELEKYFLESNSTTIRLFYTNDRVRAKNDLSAVFKKIDDLTTLITGLTETLAGVSDTIQSQADVIRDETAGIRDHSLIVALALSGAILIVVVLLSVFMGTSISRRVRDLQRQLLAVSEGDFSQLVTVRGHDEIATISATVNTLLDSLNRLLGQVQRQVVDLKVLGSELGERMAETSQAAAAIQASLGSSEAQLVLQTQSVSDSVSSARSLGAVTANLSQAFQSQLEILSASSAGIEHIIANIGSVNEGTARAEDSSRILDQVSREGQNRLDLVARAVQEIARSSENLMEVTAIIDDIADKTHMLAMNASIEAARAGDSGRGFGVVASEIRNLADQAGSQAREIANDLSSMGTNIRDIDEATQLAVEVFRKIVTQTEQVGAIAQDVQSTMDEQNREGTLVLDGLQRLHRTSGLVGTAVDDIKRGETEIVEKIEALATQNARVNQNNEAALETTRQIACIVEKTYALAETTRQQIAALEGETDQFKTRTLAAGPIPA
jgi:methyl-accepting chemotaxis protein